MAKKEWTDEERKAFGEKMKKARLDKETRASYPPEKTEDNTTSVGTHEPVEASSDNADIGELLNRIKELEARVTPQALQEPVQNQRGSLVGTFEKYSTQKGYYPDQRDRLSDEPRLQRFAFKDNYELEFSVGISSYTSIDNRRIKEPKFTLKLIRIVYDEDTGDRKVVYDPITKEMREQRYVVTQMIFHEDPEAALTIAQDVGFDVESLGEKDFLNEMRYLRMRDWLLDCFYPPAPPKASDRSEMVIGNRLVEVYTVNSETPQPIPFSSISKRL